MMQMPAQPVMTPEPVEMQPQMMVVVFHYQEVDGSAFAVFYSLV